jgi:microcystin-dependent protein
MSDKKPFVIKSTMLIRTSEEPTNPENGQIYNDPFLGLLIYKELSDDWVSVGAGGGPEATPIGSIVAYNPGYYTDSSNTGFATIGPAGNTVSEVNSFLPSNWRVCDGSELTDIESPIFNVAGRHLPNLTNSLFLLGTTQSGDVGGNSTVVLEETNLPPHVHSINHTHSATNTGGISANHSHQLVSGSTTYPNNVNLANAGANFGYAVSGANATFQAAGTTSGGAHTHSVSVPGFTGNSGSTGSSTPFDIIPPYLSTFYIIRVK